MTGTSIGGIPTGIMEARLISLPQDVEPVQVQRNPAANQPIIQPQQQPPAAPYLAIFASVRVLRSQTKHSIPGAQLFCR